MDQPFFLYSLANEPFHRALNSPQARETQYWLRREWRTLRAWWFTPDRVIPAKEAVPRLDDYLSYLQERLKGIFENHSPSYWLLLGRADRRYQMERVLIHLKAENIGRKLSSLVACSVEGIYECAAVRFGRTDIGDLQIATRKDYPTPLSPSSPIGVADIENSRRAFELCLAFDAANECLRHAARGAAVGLYSEFPFLISHMDEKYAKLQGIHEARGLALSNAGSWFGLPLNFLHTNDFPGTGAVIFEFLPVDNAWKDLGPLPRKLITKMGLPEVDEGVGPGAFYRTQLDLGPLWTEMAKYPSAFQGAFGISHELFFAVWVALHRMALTRFSEDAMRVSYGAQAYGFVVLPPLDVIIPDLLQRANEVLNDVGFTQRLKEGIKGEDLVRKSLLALGKGWGDIDLRVLSRASAVIPGQNATLLDVTQGRDLYQHVLDIVKVKKGTEGREKGQSFEQYARERVQSLAPKATSWERGLENIIFTDGHEGEFDICVVRGDCMILVECKAYSISMKYLRGDRRALRDRTDELMEALKQAEKTAKHLAESPTGHGYHLPSNVKYLVTVVCTALTEWVGTDEPEYWLDGKTPRFCTPEELGRLLHHNGGNFFAHLPYGHKVVR